MVGYHSLQCDIDSSICFSYVLAVQRTFTTHPADVIVDNMCSFGSTAVFAFASSTVALVGRFVDFVGIFTDLDRISRKIDISFTV